MPLECFYTLPCLNENGISWRIDTRLRDRINSLREQITPVEYPTRDPLSAAIARYLFKQFQEYPDCNLLRTHWIAFLAKRCERVARQCFSRIPASLQYLDFQDLFITGLNVASNPLQFFINFDVQHSINYWYPNLIGFSDIRLKNSLLSELRRITGNNTLGQTNLGLAASCSRKRVREAVASLGYGHQLTEYVLAWQCFQEYRQSTSLSVKEFREEDFNAIAQRYRQLQDLPLTQNYVNGTQIQAWIEKIGQAIRHLSYPPVVSLDAPVYSQENDDTLLENISFDPTEDLAINQILPDLMRFIDRVLQDLPEQQQQILFLSYGLNLGQSEIGQKLGGIPQCTISRILKRVKNKIISDICNWAAELNFEITPEMLPQIKVVLEEVLSDYYSQKIDYLGKRFNL